MTTQADTFQLGPLHHLTLHLIIWLPLTVVLVLCLMRPAKALMIALQYKHRRQDFEDQP